MQINNIRADSSLLYAIQRPTKQNSADVLSYFYKIITELVDAAKKSNARVPKRSIKSMYPDTGIPYQCEIHVGDWRGQDKSIYAYITFPKNQVHIQNLDVIMREIAENSLLGGEVPKIADFTAPAFKAPRGKKHLIND